MLIQHIISSVLLSTLFLGTLSLQEHLFSFQKLQQSTFFAARAYSLQNSYIESAENYLQDLQTKNTTLSLYDNPQFSLHDHPKFKRMRLQQRLNSEHLFAFSLPESHITAEIWVKKNAD